MSVHIINFHENEFFFFFNGQELDNFFTVQIVNFHENEMNSFVFEGLGIINIAICVTTNSLFLRIPIVAGRSNSSVIRVTPTYNFFFILSGNFVFFHWKDCFETIGS